MGGFTLGRKESSMEATNFPASYRVVQLLLLGVMLIGGCSQAVITTRVTVVVVCAHALCFTNLLLYHQG